jgi:hypothetical protein
MKDYMSSIYVTVESFHGSNIESIADEAVDLCDKLLIPIKFVFNKIEFFVYPGRSVHKEDRKIDILNYYDAQVKERAEAAQILPNTSVTSLIESVSKW